MASSLAKIGWTTLRKRENKNYRSVLFLPEQAKIGWEMPTKRQNKNFLSIPFLPDT